MGSGHVSPPDPIGSMCPHNRHGPGGLRRATATGPSPRVSFGPEGSGFPCVSRSTIFDKRSGGSSKTRDRTGLAHGLP